jgi:hypothetical protein
MRHAVLRCTTRKQAFPKTKMLVNMDKSTLTNIFQFNCKFWVGVIFIFRRYSIWKINWKALLSGRDV